MERTTENLDMVIGDLEIDISAEAATTTCVQIYCLPA